eukprot:766012-Hanusia_phi.AAC.1
MKREKRSRSDSVQLSASLFGFGAELHSNQEADKTFSELSESSHSVLLEEQDHEPTARSYQEYMRVKEDALLHDTFGPYAENFRLPSYAQMLHELNCTDLQGRVWNLRARVEDGNSTRWFSGMRLDVLRNLTALRSGTLKPEDLLVNEEEEEEERGGEEEEVERVCEMARVKSNPTWSERLLTNMDGEGEELNMLPLEEQLRQAYNLSNEEAAGAKRIYLVFAYLGRKLRLSNVRQAVEHVLNSQGKWMELKPMAHAVRKMCEDIPTLELYPFLSIGHEEELLPEERVYEEAAEGRDAGARECVGPGGAGGSGGDAGDVEAGWAERASESKGGDGGAAAATTTGGGGGGGGGDGGGHQERFRPKPLYNGTYTKIGRVYDTDILLRDNWDANSTCNSMQPPDSIELEVGDKERGEQE